MSMSTNPSIYCVETFVCYLKQNSAPRPGVRIIGAQAIALQVLGDTSTFCGYGAILKWISKATWHWKFDNGGFTRSGCGSIF